MTITRHLRRPREEKSVDQAGDWAAFGGASGDDFSDGKRAVDSDLGELVLYIVSWLEPIIVAVGKGGELQALGGGSSGFGDAALGKDTGGEGDLETHVNETLGELERRVDVALCRKSQEEDVAVLHHCGGE